MTADAAPFLLPLCAAFLYVISALLFKRASAFGVGVWRTTFVAVTCLNRRDADRPTRHVGITLLSGGLGSICFALFDVLVQKWTPAWGIGRMVPLIFYFGALLSFALLPFFRAPLREIPRGAWPWLGGGALLLGTQSALFIGSFAIFKHATRANILYSVRGLFSVLAVWLVGHWFANDERHAGAVVLRWRLAGALLMMAAIALVMR